MKHTFIYQETYGNTKLYLIKCEKTGGEFSTKMWLDRTCKKNYCPCCGEIIK